MSDDGYLDHPKAIKTCPLCSGGGLLDDGGNLCAVMVPCICTGEASAEVIVKVRQSYGDRLLAAIRVERTGNAFSIASSEFRVYYPDGHVGSIWSPPWHDYDTATEEANALKAAQHFWTSGTHKDIGGKVVVEDGQ